jgi:REP element-mobilizing transposase RayT
MYLHLRHHSASMRPWFFHENRSASLVPTCCDDRRPIFRFRTSREGACRSESSEFSFAVHAYCLMPDHVRLLLEGLKPACDLVQFVKILKQKSGFDYAKNTGTRLWQRFFYDHILRPNDAPDGVAWYIWLNPVRAGLCVAPQDYPFCGSFTVDFHKRIAPRELWAPPWKSAT